MLKLTPPCREAHGGVPSLSVSFKITVEATFPSPSFSGRPAEANVSLALRPWTSLSDPGPAPSLLSFAGYFLSRDLGLIAAYTPVLSGWDTSLKVTCRVLPFVWIEKLLQIRNYMCATKARSPRPHPSPRPRHANLLLRTSCTLAAGQSHPAFHYSLFPFLIHFFQEVISEVLNVYFLEAQANGGCRNGRGGGRRVWKFSI